MKGDLVSGPNEASLDHLDYTIMTPGDLAILKKTGTPSKDEEPLLQRQLEETVPEHDE